MNNVLRFTNRLKSPQKIHLHYLRFQIKFYLYFSSPSTRKLHMQELKPESITKLLRNVKEAFFFMYSTVCNEFKTCSCTSVILLQYLFTEYIIWLFFNIFINDGLFYDIGKKARFILIIMID